jgi:flagella basal body P-ring formation protein FlgA
MTRYLALLLLTLPQTSTAGALLAARTLPAGTVISAEDITLSGGSEDDTPDISKVVGLQLRTMVYQGRKIDPSLLTAPTLVSRNQIVTIAYERSALRIEAEGRALSSGGVGQVIRVMNSTSRVTVSGKIAQDGTVIVAQN